MPASDFPVEADPAKLRQIFLNLLSNAVKFTEAGGRVSLIVQNVTDEAFEVQVIDTGIDIAPEDIPLALAPFGQVDSRLARQYEGTGLGLPLSKVLIELHGGTLRIDSAIGKGTTVTISLPRRAKEQPAEEAVAA